MGFGLDDIPVYRALFPEQEARFWGSESVIDPRITPTEIARRTGISRSAVQVRLKRWRESGFWVGYEVWPNPRLFGVNVATVDVPVGGLAAVDELLDSLLMVEGVISARDLLDENGRSVRAYVINDGPPGLERRRRLIGKVAGTASDLRCQDYWIPETLDSLTRLDWKIVAYYRAFPEAKLSAAATRLGVTPKTLSRRRDRLLQSNALWWLLATNSGMFPVAAFYARLSSPTFRNRVKDALEAQIRGWIPCADDGFGSAPAFDLDMVAGLSFVTSPASMDNVARQILGIPGVSSVRWKVPRGFRSYREWFDRAIRARLSYAQPGPLAASPQPGSLAGATAYFESLAGESMALGRALAYAPIDRSRLLASGTAASAPATPPPRTNRPGPHS